MGFGNDGHGQNVTKASVRAARNAIEFNSIPSINSLVPGGYDNLKLQVILAVPKKYQEGLDVEKVKEVFPYGECEVVVQDGGMIAPSGIAIEVRESETPANFFFSSSFLINDVASRTRTRVEAGG